MDSNQTLRQLIQTNKMAFDYNFTMMLASYEQNKLLLHSFLSQHTELHPEVVGSIEHWLMSYRNGCENLKKITDDGYESVVNYMNSVDKK